MRILVKMCCLAFFLLSTEASERMIENFNREWIFNLGDVPGAQVSGFDDSGWRGVCLPHDWSVELSFGTNNAGGCTGFLPGGIGWYRKHFIAPESSRGKTVRIDFDGVYNNSDVWINGHHVGHRPYGYSPFSYEIQDFLNFGAENTIAVKADRTAYMDCRWYPGSGIYRNVELVTHDPVHIAQHGLFVTTEQNRQVTVRTTVVNGSSSEKMITVTSSLKAADGAAAGVQGLDLKVAAGQSKDVTQIFELAGPALWSPDHPTLYSAEVKLFEKGQLLDNRSTTFGIRDIRYDANEGFFLNGENTLLRGVCLHHDGGCVGAAVPNGVWERRLRILKEGGCNAIRTAHNPPSKEFLDLCDRMGFLVQDEALDEWSNPKDKKYNFGQQVADERTLGYSESYDEWAERDVKAMVLRDRNHPSIIMWSIGNEIEWTYPGYGYATGYWNGPRQVDYYWNEPPYSLDELKERYSEDEQGDHVLARQAADLSRWIKEVDVSRPVTANLVMPSVSHFSGYADALDIVGYSYRTVLNRWGHKNYPDKMILGTENWAQWSEWKGVLDNPHIPGVFLWTGIDYLGESTNWPKKNSDCGLLSTAGFRKPNYWFFKTFWMESEPQVYIVTQPLAESNYLILDSRVVENPDRPRAKTWGWPDVSSRWNYQSGEPVYVELYSNCEETELFLNGISLGTRHLADCEDRLMKWAVPFEAGTLKAIGRNAGKEIVSQTLESAGKPESIRLTVDKSTLAADGTDVVHCIAQLIDANGRPVRHIQKTVRFTVEGNARNLGVDNGAPESTQDFQSDTCCTDLGRCLMVLQAGEVPGPVSVTVSGEDLAPARVELRVEL